MTEKLFENLPILNQGINKPKPKTITAAEAVNLDKQTKINLIKDIDKTLKRTAGNDPSSWPSNPEQLLKLKNIETLEKSLGIQKNTWTRFVSTGAMPAPDNSISSAKMYETMRNGMSPNERRGYDMEQQNYDRRRNKEIKQEKVQEFRLKAAAKAKAAAPAKAMAEEIVQSIKRNPIIDEVLTRSEARLQPSYEPMFNYEPQPKKEMGLHREFAQQKLDEGRTIKAVLDE